MTFKTAFITGAGDGIGRAVALQLSSSGFRVYAAGRTRQNVEQTAAMAPSHAVVPLCMDVRDTTSVLNAATKIPNLDALVLNAGICSRAALNDPNANDVWNNVLATNLTGVWNTLFALQSKLIPGAKVVAVSSGLGKLGRSGYTAYAAAKHGLLGMVKCLALELAPRQINVNAVCPGWVDTAMAQKDLARSALENNTSVLYEQAEAKKKIPLGRFVQAEEVARLIQWLVSDAAAAVTGQSFNISCGEFTQ